MTLIVGLDVVAGYSLTARLARRNLELERQRRASRKLERACYYASLVVRRPAEFFFF